MGLIREAYAAHAALSVTGVRRIFDLDEVPLGPSNSDLPCIIPILPSSGEGPAQSIPTMSPVDHANLIYTPRFYVLVSAAGGGRGLKTIQPETLDIYEAYMAALRHPDNWTLGGNLSDVVLVGAPQFGTIEFPAGTEWSGFTVTHKWLIDIRTYNS